MLAALLQDFQAELNAQPLCYTGEHFSLGCVKVHLLDAQESASSSSAYTAWEEALCAA